MGKERDDIGLEAGCQMMLENTAEIVTRVYME